MKDSRTNDRVLRLAIVGCGAVTERLHVPALRRIPAIQCAAFVDSDLERARRLAGDFGGAEIARDMRELRTSADAVLIALPNWLHAQTTIQALDQGLHVLVEKPMATTIADGEAMIAASRRSGAVLAVAHPRRFFPNRQRLKRMVDGRELGEVRRIQVTDGLISDWPVSLDFFRYQKAGGGVLMDMGVHELDIVLWLMGEAAVVEYADDNLGGVESNAYLDLLGADGSRASARFSRTTYLSNQVRLEGTRGWAEVSTWDWNSLRYLSVDDPACKRGPVEVIVQNPPIDYVEIYAAQLRAFVKSVEGRPSPIASGEDGLRVLKVVERCYSISRAPEATTFHQPTTRTNAAPVWKPQSLGALGQSRGGTALITGATGFIGGRLAERLVLDEGWQVQALVREPGTARWLCRLPIELVHGSLTDETALESAMAGCDVVFHCGAAVAGTPDEWYASNVLGTENVARVAARLGVRRLIHLSSVAVYGKGLPNLVDENTPLRSTDSGYATSKLQAEHIVERYMRENGLPAVILRPTLVYGPRCRWFTIEPMKKICAGYMALVEHGQGLCNLNYVDNLVDALILSVEVEAALGEVFVISDRFPIPWKEFLNAHAALVDKAPLPEWSESMVRMAARLHRTRFVHRFVRSWPWLSQEEIDHMKNGTSYGIRKAQHVLGYEPRVSFADGMRETAAWLKDQNYLVIQ